MYGSHLSHIFEKPRISVEKPSFLMWNSDFYRKTKYFKLRKQVFQSVYQKSKFSDRKTWFFHQAPGNHMFMQRALIQRLTKKPRVRPPSSSYLLHSWLLVTWRPLEIFTTISLHQ